HGGGLHGIFTTLHLPISPPAPRQNLLSLYAASAPPRSRRRLGALLHPPVHQNALAAAGAEPLHRNATSAEHDPDAVVEGGDERAASLVQQPPQFPALERYDETVVARVDAHASIQAGVASHPTSPHRRRGRQVEDLRLRWQPRWRRVGHDLAEPWAGRHRIERGA